MWRKAVAELRTWSRRGERAVHKPLLLLVLLGRAAQGRGSVTRFIEIQEQLTALLRDYGRPTKRVHPEYPFWHLQSDFGGKLWSVDDADEIPKRTGGHGNQVTKLALLQLLNLNWPDSLHAEIRSAVGLPQVLQSDRQARDPAFRISVLVAYEKRCAVCGYGGRIGDSLLALDAAHIHAWCEGGPDVVQNGLALCSFHHVSFDRGAISLSDAGTILVSQHLSGDEMTKQLLVRHSGQPLRAPLDGSYFPARAFVEWHRKFVFRGPPRPAYSVAP
jgi:putative restriction endonuclease